MNRIAPRATRLLLERRARALKKHLPAAIHGDAAGVHQARVASRRLREAIPVLSHDVKTGKAAKAQSKVRKLTRALGGVRELDVALSVLDELAAQDRLPRLALEEVRTYVIDEREQRRSTMLKRLDRVRVDKLDRRLASVAQALQASQSERWRESLAARLAKRGKALAAAMTEAGQMYNPDSLHRVRIATKKLRYGLEIAAEGGIRAALPLVRQLKKVQDTLGRLHDLQMLEARVAAVQARPPARELPEGSLAALARALEEECRHLHGRYIALSPALRATIDGTRPVLAQLVRPAGRRRPLKMALAPKKRRPAADAPAATGARVRH
jgi:CHAD domain-containing protein